MASMAQGSGTADVDALDVDWFRDTITVIKLMALSRSTRADIDARTNECLEHLKELASTDLGADQDAKVRALFRRAYQHMDLSNRPTSATPAFAAFEYMDELASITFALMQVYVLKNEDQAQ